MRFLIVIAALLASVSASASELDGKAVLCRKDGNPFYEPIGWEFRDGVAREHFVIAPEGTKAEVWVASADGFGDPSRYEAGVTEVRWTCRGSRYVLDRKTLSLQQISSITGDVLKTTICEVSSSVAAMEQEMEAARQVRQKYIDDRMKDNKI